MAKMALKYYTLERLPLATKEAQERVHVTEKKEKEKWQDIVDKIYLPEDKGLVLGIFLLLADVFLIKRFVRWE